MSVIIEAAGMNDLPDVMRVMSLAFDRRFGESWTAGQCMGLLAMPHCGLSIARDGAAVGFAIWRCVLDECELMLLAVVPSMRRNGIGRSLLDHIMAEARGHGARTLHLEVRANNPAIALYSSAGLVEIGLRPCYYRGVDGEMFDAVTYRYTL